MESTCVVRPLSSGYVSHMGGGSVALLNMLAEVASQKLHSDPSVKEMACRKNVNRTRSAKKNARAMKISEFSIEELRNFTANNLLKLFTEFDGNEMKKTFTFTCFLEPKNCKKEISSFGSETKARKLMKCHLMEHISDFLSRFNTEKPNLTEAVNLQKRQNTETVPDLRKRRRISNDVKNGSFHNSENPMKSDEFFTNDKQCEINSKTVTDKTCERTCANDSVLQIKNDGSSPDHDCTTNTVHSDHNYASLSVLHEVRSEDDDVNSMSVEETTTDYDNCNVLPLSSSKVDENMNTPSAEIDKNLVTDLKTSYSSRTEDCNMPHIPWIEQEVKISTSFSILPQNDCVDVLIDNSSEVSCVDNRDNSTVCIENKGISQSHFEKESTNKKKPKGKAKFIGQSQAEKEMAVQLIDFMKFNRISNDNLKCHICIPSRSFTAATTLISHYRSHAGIKPYECRICCAVFTRQHSLNYHMLIHSNQTRFTCTECGRKFRHPSHFKEHLRRHTGESPFQCSDCMTRFKTRNTYKRHLKTRHGKVLTSISNVIIASEDGKPEEYSQETVVCEQKLNKVVKEEYVSEETVSLPDIDQFEKEEEEDRPWEPSADLQIVQNEELPHCLNSDNVEEPGSSDCDPENVSEAESSYLNHKNVEMVPSYLSHKNEDEQLANHLSHKTVENDTHCYSKHENIEENVTNYLDDKNEKQKTRYSDQEVLDLNQCYSDLVEEVIRETNSILFTDRSNVTDKVKVESVWMAPENFSSLNIPHNWNAISAGLENLQLKDVPAEVSRHCYNPVCQSQLIVSSTVQSCIQASDIQAQNMGITIADLVYSFPT